VVEAGTDSVTCVGRRSVPGYVPRAYQREDNARPQWAMSSNAKRGSIVDQGEGSRKAVSSNHATSRRTLSGKGLWEFTRSAGTGEKPIASRQRKEVVRPVFSTVEKWLESTNSEESRCHLAVLFLKRKKSTGKEAKCHWSVHAGEGNAIFVRR